MVLEHRPLIVVTLLLIASVLARVAVSATMPMTMLVSAPTNPIIASAAQNGDAHADCPGHTTPSQNDGAITEQLSSCVSCGDCCVVAPMPALRDASDFLQFAPQQHPARDALPPYSYLTPGIDRPPAFSR